MSEPEPEHISGTDSDLNDEDVGGGGTMVGRERGSDAVQRLIKNLEDLKIEELTFLNLSYEQIGKLTLELQRYFAPDYVPTEIGQGFVDRQLKHGNKWGEVDISYENLTEFPMGLLQLTRLQKISLVGNEIEVIPDQIDVFSELVTLNLNRNHIKTVPPSIAKLPRLEDLRLGFNMLTTLPDEMGTMTQLKTLYLTNNLFETVPEVLQKLNMVPGLCLAKNPLEQPKKGKGKKGGGKKKKK